MWKFVFFFFCVINIFFDAMEINNKLLSIAMSEAYAWAYLLIVKKNVWFKFFESFVISFI